MVGEIIMPEKLTGLPDSLGGTHWKTRAVRECKEDELMLPFVLAVLGLQHGIRPPRFGNKARIDLQGNLHSDMQDVNYNVHRDMMLGPVEVVRDNFRRLADHLKLDDHERIAMMDEFKKWIAHDERANRTPQERGLDK